MDTSELTRLIEAAGLSSALAAPPQARVDAILRDAAAALGVNAATHWWWAHKDVALTSASDTDGDLLRRLGSCGLEAGSTCILFATDDRSPPWPVTEGVVRDLVHLLEESYLFEFMLVRADGRRIAMENHHGHLLCWRAAPA